MDPLAQTADDQEIVTIIAPSIAEAMRAARDRGLTAQVYSIQGRVVSHRFAMADEAGESDLFSGAPMVAATWVRRNAAAASADATLLVEPATA